MKIEDDFESMVLMDSVQLEKCPPSKIRQTLLDNDSETIIATVYAAASNHVGWLMYDLDEDDCTEETKQEYNEWEILENEISNKIFDILKTEDIKEYGCRTLISVQIKMQLWIQMNNSKEYGYNSNCFTHTEDRATLGSDPSAI